MFEAVIALSGLAREAPHRPGCPVAAAARLADVSRDLVAASVALRGAPEISPVDWTGKEAA